MLGCTAPSASTFQGTQVIVIESFDISVEIIRLIIKTGKIS
jgi:hypothetical protein